MNDTDDTEPLLKIQAVAKILNKSTRSVARLCDLGAIEYINLGSKTRRDFRFKMSAVTEFKESRTVRATKSQYKPPLSEPTVKKF